MDTRPRKAREGAATKEKRSALPEQSQLLFDYQEKKDKERKKARTDTNNKRELLSSMEGKIN